MRDEVTPLVGQVLEFPYWPFPVNRREQSSIKVHLWSFCILRLFFGLLCLHGRLKIDRKEGERGGMTAKGHKDSAFKHGAPALPSELYQRPPEEV